MVMVALAIEIVAFAGLMDILFSYMRFQLKWTDKEYGWFNGAGTVLAVNAVLATLGLLTKISNLLVLAFVTTSWVAMVSVVLLIFGRFISTGLRSLASFYVKNNEQGKIFSFISFMEGVSFLVASFIFNGLYPATLKFFPGTMLLVVAAALLIPVFLLVYIERHKPKNVNKVLKRNLNL
uniref:Uncharacterized protein n=1 Tax=Ditylenchus dipsaci TaxID=166011 RepID=A0A915EPD1_9BILA